MAEYVLLNGEIIPQKEAFVPVNTQALWYGDGCFTTARVHEGKVNSWNQHIQRIKNQCHGLTIQPPIILKENIDELLEKNNSLSNTWCLRILVTTHQPLQCNAYREPSTVLVTVDKITKTTTPLRLYLSPQGFFNPYARIKSNAYLPYLLFKQEAVTQGFDDCLITTPDGNLLETSCSNFFWIDQKVLFTPTPSLPILWGTSIQKLVKNYHKVEPIKTALNTMPREARCYTCNSLKGITAISEIGIHSFPICDKEKEELETFL